MRLKMRGGLTTEKAKKIVENAPSTPDAHIEAIQELINSGVGLFTFMGSIDNLKKFGEKVITTLK